MSWHQPLGRPRRLVTQFRIPNLRTMHLHRKLLGNNVNIQLLKVIQLSILHWEEPP